MFPKNYLHLNYKAAHIHSHTLALATLFLRVLCVYFCSNYITYNLIEAGAEMLTSQDTKTNGADDDGAQQQHVITHAQRGAAAKHAGYDRCGDNVHSVMETAKTHKNNNTSTTQHNQQQQQTDVVADMGTGNDEAVAATKIQAGFRGYQVRKQMKLKKVP